VDREIKRAREVEAMHEILEIYHITIIIQALQEVLKWQQNHVTDSDSRCK
jgi:hypothetical protein